MFDYISRLLARKVVFDDSVCNLGTTNVQGAIEALCTTSADPFALALFDENCDPLWDKSDNCTVTLMLECG